MIAIEDMTIKTYTSIEKDIGNRFGLSLLKDTKVLPKRGLSLMLLSIGIGAGNLQPEKDIDRTADRTYQISL